MNALDDPLLYALAVLCCGHDCDPRDTEGIAFLVPTPDRPNDWLIVTWPEFDAMIERGWVAYVGTDEFEATESGRYWYLRWIDREERRQSRTGPKRLTGRKRQLLRGT